MRAALQSDFCKAVKLAAVGVGCRGSGRARFLRGPFATLLARMVAFNCFPVAIVPLRLAGVKGLACEGIFSQSTRPVESINLSAS